MSSQLVHTIGLKYTRTTTLFKFRKSLVIFGLTIFILFDHVQATVHEAWVVPHAIDYFNYFKMSKPVLITYFYGYNSWGVRRILVWNVALAKSYNKKTKSEWCDQCLSYLTRPVETNVKIDETEEAWSYILY